MTPRFPHLLPVFLLEAEHCLDDLAAAIARLTNTVDDVSSWRSATRAAHTLKGNAAMMMLDDIQQTALTAELCAQSGAAQPEAGLVVRLTVCLMQLRDQLDALVAEASARNRQGCLSETS